MAPNAWILHVGQENWQEKSAEETVTLVTKRFTTSWRQGVQEYHITFYFYLVIDLDKGQAKYAVSYDNEQIVRIIWNFSWYVRNLIEQDRRWNADKPSATLDP